MGEEMGKRKLGMRMWGYLPAASSQRAPLLRPTIAPQFSLQEEVRSVCGGGCGFGLAITESGKISMWGSTNDLGQSYNLRGSPQEQKEPYLLDVSANIVQVAGGWAHSAAVTDEGSVCTWGWSKCVPYSSLVAEQGADALAMSINKGNDVVAPGSPCSISSYKVYGRQERRVLHIDAPISDGTTSVDDHVMSPPSFVSLAPGVIITSVAAGGRHTLALSDAGKVWGWGCSGEGQLGLGYRLSMTSTPQHIKYLEATHWTSNESSNQNDSAVAELSNLPAETFGNHVTRIACGGRHSVVVTDAGAVLSFGWGLYGQCGQGSTEDQLRPGYVSALSGIKVTGLAAGLWHTVFITDTGDVYASGGNQFGQLGTLGDQAEMLPTLIDAPVLENENATSVSCGARHTAVLTEYGKIFCWGWNKYGQLGVGDTENKDTPVEVPLGNAVARGMACGWWHTLALVEEDS